MNDSYNDKDSRAIALGSFPHLQVNDDTYGVDFYTGHIDHPNEKLGLDAKCTGYIDTISVIEKWNKKINLEMHEKYLQKYCDELYEGSVPLIEQIEMIQNKYNIKKQGNLFDLNYHFLYNTEGDELVSLIKFREILNREKICLKILVNKKGLGDKIDSSKDNFLSAYLRLPQDLKQKCLEPKENLVGYQFD